MARRIFHAVGRGERPPMDLTPLSELTLMISQGYGDVPQWQMPENWRTVRFEDQEDFRIRHMIGVPEEMLPRHGKNNE